ncbi:hypothetical protein PVAND_015321 [Polypedilum vanderplanki]|uniref:Lipase domain-containing protein n=1 Tax=Polypedilum vanderplanki TaxID=319348 RepID=A0A9J6BCA6_POLVA|nr:hypothetical protein PVAND_015321 [Polypedilum vanderplanki]
MSFYNNKITLVGKNLFKPLNVSQITFLEFYQIHCASSTAYSSSYNAISNLIDSILSNCGYDDELWITTPTTTTVKTTTESNFPNGTISQMNDTMTTHGCDPDGNATFIVHGWIESIEKSWAMPMIAAFLKTNGNCVFFMDYWHYAMHWYIFLLPNFESLSDLLMKKVNVIANPQKTTFFGFSFGARIVISAGVKIARNGTKVAKIYACDPAGPGFGHFGIDQSTAADFVQCVHTSNTYGTGWYDCSQNWRMGVCGHSQPGARPFPYGSHGLCPYIFLSSFENDFKQDNYYNCTSDRLAKDLPDNLIMGPMETRTEYRGDIFAPTAVNPPFNVINRVINNQRIKPPSGEDVDDFSDLLDDKSFNDEKLEENYVDILEYNEKF